MNNSEIGEIRDRWFQYIKDTDKVIGTTTQHNSKRKGICCPANFVC